jgi:hypothetical protein
VHEVEEATSADEVLDGAVVKRAQRNYLNVEKVEAESWDLTLDDEGILVRVDVKGHRAQVVVPDSLKSAVLHWAHGSVTVGHWGLRRIG